MSRIAKAPVVLPKGVEAQIANGLVSIKGGKKVAPGFSYTSDNNPHWMKPEELQAWIDAHTDKIGSI